MTSYDLLHKWSRDRDELAFHEIDRLMYALYGLTETELKIVEKAAK